MRGMWCGRALRGWALGLTMAASALAGLGPVRQAQALICGVQVESVSVSSAGTFGNNGSYAPSVSADGRFVAFSSYATNLTAGDTNGAADVFVRDRLLDTTERVSLTAAGGQANGASWHAWISGDGRYVAFESDAGNLAAGDTNGARDVFVRDRLMGATERVSVSTEGEQGSGTSGAPVMTPDGRSVAFQSDASNLVAGDTNGARDVFVRDREAGTTERISISSAGEQGDAQSGGPSITSEGALVAFESQAANLVTGDTNGAGDIFVRNRGTGETVRVSISSAGAQADNSCFLPSIAGNGQYVAFWSNASNLVTPPVGFTFSGLFLRNLPLGETIWVPAAMHPEPTAAMFSPDGAYVAHERWWSGIGGSDHLYITLFNTLLGIATDLPCNIIVQPAISADGRFVAFRSWGSSGNVFVYDRFPQGVIVDTRILTGHCGEHDYVCGLPAVFTWHGTDSSALPYRYSWRLDGGEWQPWSMDESKSFGVLAQARHVLEVKARDAAGNEDPTPARCEFLVDLDAPLLSTSAPADGATVRAPVKIRAQAWEGGWILNMQLFVGGRGLGGASFYYLGGGPINQGFSWEWDPSDPSEEEGPVEVCVKAWDTCQHETQKCITLTIPGAIFDDVPRAKDSIWPYVDALAERGIVAGCSVSPRLYCSEGRLTRGQLAVMSCKAAGKGPLYPPRPTFADVPATNPLYGWVERFCDPESWGGNAPGGGCNFSRSRRFCPDGFVSREQIAPMLCRAAGKSPLPSCSGVFADVAGGSPLCPWIERLAEAASWGGTAVTNGCALGPPRLYCPRALVTRGQAAVLIVRAFRIPI